MTKSEIEKLDPFLVNKPLLAWFSCIEWPTQPNLGYDYYKLRETGQPYKVPGDEDDHYIPRDAPDLPDNYPDYLPFPAYAIRSSHTAIVLDVIMYNNNFSMNEYETAAVTMALQSWVNWSGQGVDLCTGYTRGNSKTQFPYTILIWYYVAFRMLTIDKDYGSATFWPGEHTAFSNWSPKVVNDRNCGFWLNSPDPVGQVGKTGQNTLWNPISSTGGKLNGIKEIYWQKVYNADVSISIAYQNWGVEIVRNTPWFDRTLEKVQPIVIAVWAILFKFFPIGGAAIVSAVLKDINKDFINQNAVHFRSVAAGQQAQAEIDYIKNNPLFSWFRSLYLKYGYWIFIPIALILIFIFWIVKKIFK